MKVKSPSLKLIELDGRTGEGGGQLVRIAVGLAAVVGQPIRIINVRGNRGDARRRGLKAQHVNAIEWLASATDARTTGVSVGSSTLEFHPRVGPAKFSHHGKRKIRIETSSPASSTLLIFQAIFPFLLFAGTEEGTPIEVELSGGTNVSFSLSYEYLDQVLLPTLEEQFGIRVDRRLEGRGWSMGSPSGRGNVQLTINPLKPGETLKWLAKQPTTITTTTTTRTQKVKTIDVSILTPTSIHDSLMRYLTRDLGSLFPEAEVNFVLVQDSRHESRNYVLCVAKSDDTGDAPLLRWGRDLLFEGKEKKGKASSSSNEAISQIISRRVCKAIHEEVVAVGGVVDEFLQDQLVVFQALAGGRTSFPRSEEKPGEKKEEEGDVVLAQAVDRLDLEEQEGRSKMDRMDRPFGEGSTHTTTARWVTAQLLPQVQ